MKHIDLQEAMHLIRALTYRYGEKNEINFCKKYIKIDDVMRILRRVKGRGYQVKVKE